MKPFQQRVTLRPFPASSTSEQRRGSFAHPDGEAGAKGGFSDLEKF